MLNIDSSRKEPVYLQIYQALREDIQKGIRRAGERLPSTRGLAQDLAVSRSTVIMAYEQLVCEGYAETRQGSGYYVLPLDAFFSPGGEMKMPSEPMAGQPAVPSGIDFSPRGIDLENFPLDTWRKLTREVLTTANKELFFGGDPRGEHKLRRQIAGYLYRARGVSCSPASILLGAGSDVLLVLLHQLLGREAVIGMENPTYRQAYMTFKQLGHSIVPVPMDWDGMSVEGLEASGADVAYVMPSHQFPTGIVMPVQRRLQLLQWAGARKGRYIIEDDYDSEFRYKGRPIPALHSIPHHDTVIYLGTFSKSIAPGIRISYMVLPPTLLDRYEKYFTFYASTVSRIDQEILTRFMEGGYFERHLNKMRALYRSKQETLLEQIRLKGLPVSVYGENAGLHVLLMLKAGRFGDGMEITEEELVKRAARKGVLVYRLGLYTIGGLQRMSPCILLGYANLSESQITEGIQALKEAWT